MSLLKKAALTLSLFTASALGAFGQNNAPQKSARQNDFFHNTQFVVLAKSFHTDRLTPYNEWNPGLFVKHQISTNDKRQLSVMEGLYYNSNYALTPTAGLLQEFKFGNVSVGLLAGVAIYRRVTSDATTFTKHYGTEVPKDEKKRGCKKTYIQLDDYRYLEIAKTYGARGIKNKYKIIPALLASFSYDAYRGTGPYATATYMPWRSGESKGLGIIAVGATVNPFPQPR